MYLMEADNMAPEYIDHTFYGDLTVTYKTFFHSLKSMILQTGQ